jgi:hypothetical protein
LLPCASVLDHFSVLWTRAERWRVLYPLPEMLIPRDPPCPTTPRRAPGEQRLDFLRRFLPYERGPPAHFKTCFANWVEALRSASATRGNQAAWRRRTAVSQLQQWMEFGRRASECSPE